MWAKISTAAVEPSSWTLLVGLSCEGDFINVSSHEAAKGQKQGSEWCVKAQLHIIGGKENTECSAVSLMRSACGAFCVWIERRGEQDVSARVTLSLLHSFFRLVSWNVWRKAQRVVLGHCKTLLVMLRKSLASPVTFLRILHPIIANSRQTLISLSQRGHQRSRTALWGLKFQQQLWKRHINQHFSGNLPLTESIQIYCSPSSHWFDCNRQTKVGWSHHQHWWGAEIKHALTPWADSWW